MTHSVDCPGSLRKAGGCRENRTGFWLAVYEMH